MASSPRARSALALLVAAGLALSTVACSGGDDAGDAEAEAANASDAPEPEAASAEVEQYTGPVDAFYDVPDPLPAGEPGDLIRTMPLETDDPDEVGLRIMYHSTDAEGDDRAVTGVAYHPTGEAPDGGWPILAWAHGTSGIAAACAPSRIPLAPPDYGVQGVQVATDYIGLGPNGELHPYLSAAAEGNAVIDSVAAVRALPEAHAGDRWVVAGHSQGGHASLITNETAAERLPDVELLGAVAAAPGSQMSESYGDDVQVRIITAMVLFGAAADDPEIDPRDYLGPDAYAAAAGVVEDRCLGEIIDTLLPLAVTPDYYMVDPQDDPAVAAWLEENDPGNVAVDSPLLLIQGGKDVIVVPARTDALFARLCDLGQVVERIDLPDADHGTELPQAHDDIAAWISARFADEPPTDDC